ncbi:VOC family protein [Streptomyces sp. NPDC006283]|uniref:VOC family protein n=1 Tax=Streptomyces sp. NPDC006283 TaxID=3156741 RepID=UPI0033A03826
MSEGTTPGITGIHHLSLTVTDIEACLAWCQRLFCDRVPTKLTHYEREDTGYGVLLIEPRSGLVIGLHGNIANRGGQFDESRTRLDDVSFKVDTREDLEAWTAWLDELGIGHTGIRDQEESFAYSTVVFRDPDDIQLEFIAVGAVGRDPVHHSDRATAPPLPGDEALRRDDDQRSLTPTARTDSQGRR